MLVHGSRWVAALCLMLAWCSQAAPGNRSAGARRRFLHSDYIRMIEYNTAALKSGMLKN